MCATIKTKRKKHSSGQLSEQLIFGNHSKETTFQYYTMLSEYPELFKNQQETWLHFYYELLLFELSHKVQK